MTHCCIDCLSLYWSCRIKHPANCRNTQQQQQQQQQQQLFNNNVSRTIYSRETDLYDVRLDEEQRCGIWLGTNLIHDFTAVTFSVKLAFFRKKRPFPCFREIVWNPWFFVNFNAFIFIYEGCQSFINSLCADFAVCYVSHFSTKCRQIS